MAAVAERIAFIGKDGQKARSFIARAGLTNGGPLPGKSPEENLIFIANTRKSLTNKGGRPLFWIIDHGRPETLLRAAQKLRGKGVKKALRNLTVIDVETEASSDHIDPQTGVRLVCYTKDDLTSFTRVHPTPDS